MKEFQLQVTHFRLESELPRVKPSQLSAFLSRLEKEGKALLATIEEGIEPAGGNAASTAAALLNNDDLVFRLRQDLKELMGSVPEARKTTLPHYYRTLRKDHGKLLQVFGLKCLFEKFGLPITEYGSGEHKTGSKFCLGIRLMFKAAGKEISFENARNLIREVNR